MARTWLAFGVLAGGLFLAAPPLARGAALDDALQAVLEVSAEGGGHAAAKEAWQTVAAADARQLPTVLAALDRASPLAANWLRGAVDVIADRTLRAGSPLPIKALEKFVLDRQHAPRARRLAYEWLVRGDPAAQERLLPSFLTDPGVDFRRDAVAHLLARADAAAAAGQAESAQETYQQALQAAVDLDQVQAVAEKLKAYGQTVDLRQHFGLLTNWQLVGPFDNAGEAGFHVAYPPETEVDLAATYTGKTGTIQWAEFASADPLGLVDLNTALGKANGVLAYAFTQFNSPAELNVEFRLTCITASKLWVNGELISEHNVYHSGSEFDQYVARTTLREGRNTILLKVCQNEQTEPWAQRWEFQLRVCDSTGTAILPAEGD